MENKIDNQIHNRSLGTVENREAQEPIFRVKEVCMLTGLTRKQLFDYQEMVPPVAYEKAGYKLYNAAAVEKLRMVAELRSIQVPLIEIGKLISGKCDKMELLQNHIRTLQSQKIELEEMIVKAEHMKGNA